ncbi:polysaccharide deacetylase family protein [Camelliibacillus cellulosilyticus]|uniref:Polysaccharide deacetylase family protein n=1 Tax=Camelliibacillus cellulosilyticus TaxID=2174486 RepID=A0ABV9GPU3_9BACL
MKKRGYLLLTMLLGTLVLSGCLFDASAQEKGEKHAPKTKTHALKSENVKADPSVKRPKDNQVAQNKDTEASKHSVNTAGWITVKQKPAKLPILMYHSISSGNSLRVPAQEFRAEMKWLKDHGYYTLTPEEAYAVLTTDKKPKEKCVWITFDDGYGDNYKEAYPVLKDYGMKATIFMIGNLIGKHGHLTESQMQEMARHGISIQSHTISHLELNNMTAQRQRDEMTKSKALFDRMFHQNTITLSYPVGRYNEATIGLADTSGYKMAVTTHPGPASRDQGLLTLHRVRISPGMSAQSFGRLVNLDNGE